MDRDQIIAIGIPTFKRPEGLRRVLLSLEQSTGDHNVRVIVVENDVDGLQGQTTVEAILDGGFRWPVELVLEKQRGISHARNALMRAAFEDDNVVALVMIDDDQWVDPNWLQELLTMQKVTEADVVGSHVLPDFVAQNASWTDGLSVYWRPKKTNGACRIIERTCGVLIARSALSYCSSPYFDLMFSLTGGGDKDFFTRLGQRGAKFAFAANAVCHEVFDSSRLNKSWARRRAYRAGGGDMRILLKYERRPGIWVVELCKIPGVLILMPLLYLFSVKSSKRMAKELKFCRACGKLLALFGVQYEEYAKTTGG